MPTALETARALLRDGNIRRDLAEVRAIVERHEAHLVAEIERLRGLVAEHCDLYGGDERDLDLWTRAFDGLHPQRPSHPDPHIDQVLREAENVVAAVNSFDRCYALDDLAKAVKAWRSRRGKETT